ncbi:MAG: hypothetical protein HFH65_01280 [Lachnospiraceae bacterium]|nr:hypothetical protein [Lachnospiraceae bacterium]
MSEFQTFLKDKPYEFVPLLEKCKRIQYSEHNVLERDTYNGKLKLKITVESPLHIGGKQQDYDEKGNIIKKQMCRNGKIIIPGSSFKGVVRAVAEAVSYSCAVKLPNNILKKALPLANNCCCSNIEDGLCITCSIFGMANESGHYRGKISFGEFILETGELVRKTIPQLESPFKNYPDSHDVFGKKKGKHIYGNERLYYCKACDTGNCQNCSKEEFFQCIEEAGVEREMRFRGRKFYNPDRINSNKGTEGKREVTNKKEFDNSEENVNKEQTCYEMIESGSVLRGEIIFQNLREEEGKLLAYALGIGQTFTIRLGYGKPLGYGKIKVELESVENISNRYAINKELNESIVRDWIQEYKTNSPDDIQEVICELERIMSKK